MEHGAPGVVGLFAVRIIPFKLYPPSEYNGGQRMKGEKKRGIEWSLRAFASMWSFLRARAVIKFVLRVASTLENTTGEQLALQKFSSTNNQAERPNR